MSTMEDAVADLEVLEEEAAWQRQLAGRVGSDAEADRVEQACVLLQHEAQQVAARLDARLQKTKPGGAKNQNVRRALRRVDEAESSLDETLAVTLPARRRELHELRRLGPEDVASPPQLPSRGVGHPPPLPQARLGGAEPALLSPPSGVHIPDDLDEELPVVRTTKHYTPVEQHCLEARKGEELFLLRDGEEGWSLVENNHGMQGWVPSKLLEPVLESDGETGDEYDDAFDSFDHDDAVVQFSELPPQPSPAPAALSPGGKSQDHGLPTATEPSQTLQFLRDKRAIPSGYRSSFLARVGQLPQHRPSTALLLRPSVSGLQYDGLQADPLSGTVQRQEGGLHLSLSVVEALSVPQPLEAPPFSTLARHVRVAMFDKHSVLGNCQTLQACWTKDMATQWKFTKAASPDALDADSVCLVKTNSVHAELVLLFELTMTVQVEPHAPEELSAGWATLPLRQVDGQPAAAKTYSLQLHGGSPHELAVLIDDESHPRPDGRSAFHGTKPSVARLVVKLAHLKKAALAMCETLPATMLVQLSSVPLVALYRELQCRALLGWRGQIGGSGNGNGLGPSTGRLGNHEPRSDAALVAFPVILDTPHLLVILKAVWNDTLKTMRRAQRKDPRAVSFWFRTVVTHKLWPLLHVKLPDVDPGNNQARHQRHDFLKRFVAADAIGELFKETRDSGLVHAPFSTDEVCYDPTSSW
eukprot:m.244579 g.244579  ORF g.244579 m.244579 type:complete len:699 (-) comp19040_c0_seq5:360-2456(-)